MKVKFGAMFVLLFSFVAQAKDLQHMGYMSGIELVANTFQTECNPIQVPKALDPRTIPQRIASLNYGVYKCHNKTDDLAATIIFDYSRPQKINQMKEIRLEDIYVQTPAKKVLSSLFSKLKSYNVNCVYESDRNIHDVTYYGKCTNEDGIKLIDFDFKTSEDHANGHLSFLRLNILNPIR